MDISVKQTAEELLGAQDIILLAHKSPDGDTLGSCFALYWALRGMGRRARVVCSDPLPLKYAYFTQTPAAEEFEGQYICSVDVADEQLLGHGSARFAGKISLCIDHHASNTGYARLRCLDPGCAATAQLVYSILLEMKATITPIIADCLFTGITTDTGCFRYSNVTPETHEIAARLMSLGADAAEINRVMFEQKTKGRMAVERIVMGSLDYDFDGKCAIVCISRDILNRTGACDEELEGVSAIPRRIEGVQVGVTFNERDNGYKLSVRTSSDIDASEVCKMLGGGGHKRAAGCFIEGDYAGARARLHEILIKFIK